MAKLLDVASCDCKVEGQTAMAKLMIVSVSLAGGREREKLKKRRESNIVKGKLRYIEASLYFFKEMAGKIQSHQQQVSNSLSPC